MVSWQSMSYDELRDFYWSEIAPKRSKQGYDPGKETPSYQWLNNHGYSGLHRALKRDHNTTTREFFNDIIDSKDEFDWPGEHRRTQQALEQFLKSLDERKNRAQSTIDAKRGRLSWILRTHVKIHGSGDLITLAQDRRKGDDGFELLLKVADELNESSDSAQSKYNHIYDLIEFYQYLLRRRIVGYNPGRLIKEEFDWDASGVQANTSPSLSQEQVKSIWNVTRNLEEELIVICYVGLGLRTAEPAELSRDNIELVKEGCPRIKFETRKNQPDTVPILVGKNQIAKRIQKVQSNVNQADCLFPSSHENRDALSDATMREKFKNLCQRADVAIEGETPTPRNARRTWYSLYTESLDKLYNKIEIAANEQGSKNLDVVREAYLSDDIEFRHHRQCMQSVLREIMPGVDEYGSEVSFPPSGQNQQASLESFGPSGKV